MSDESALMRAIISSPEDDTSRLVYSDWLDEHGQPARAEFIRTQLRLDRMKPWEEGYEELRCRERALLAKYAESWLEPVRPFLSRSLDPDRDIRDLPIFRRGFVDTVLVDVDRFLADPDGLFAAAPITGLIFWINSATLKKVLECPGLRRAKRVRFMSWRSRVVSRGERNIELSPGDYRKIASCPHFEDLKELELTSQKINSDEIGSLIRSKHLRNIETLKLAHSCVDDAGFRELGAGMALPALKRLYLNNNYDSGRLGAWLKAAWPRKLSTLDLGSCRLDITETASFLEGGAWPEMEDLSLLRMEGKTSHGRLGEALSAMPRLRRLDLSWRRFNESLNNLTKGDVFSSLEALDLGGAFAPLSPKMLQTRSFPALRYLDLTHNKLDGGIAALVDCPWTQTVRRLELRQCATDNKDVQRFARTAHLPLLECLGLGGGFAMTPRTLAELGAAEGFPRLRSLGLDLPGSVKVYEALAELPLLRRLGVLTIRGGTVGERCVKLLTGSPGFQGLTALQFWGASINRDNSRRLREHFGERYLG